MKKDTINKAKIVLDSRAQIPLLEYFKERYGELQDSLVSCNEAGVQRLQGRAQEVKDIISFIENIGR